MRDQVELHDGRRWYAVATQPGREAVAREDLSSQDFEVFLPLLAEAIGHPKRGKQDLRVRPAFGAYLFIHVVPGATEWHRITEARAVVGLVCAAGAPIPAKAGEVDKLVRLTVNGDGTLWVARDALGQPEWRAGPLVRPRHRLRLPFAMNQRLRIIDGIFAGLEGLYVGGQGKIKLALDAAGALGVTELPEALVQPA
jgi:transcription antitermination factor NusG